MPNFRENTFYFLKMRKMFSFWAEGSYCPNMCMCNDDDDTCYVFTDPPGTALGVYFYSYCGTDGCHLRAYTYYDLTNVSTNEVIPYSTLRDENGIMFPLDNPAYIKIHRINCFGCPVKKSC